MTVSEPVEIDGRPAPLEGCNCAVCQWANRRIRQEADLEANYAKYLAGLLVSSDERD